MQRTNTFMPLGYYLRIRQLRIGAMKVGSITSPEVNMRTSCLRFSYKLSRSGGYARLAVKYVKNKDVPRTIQYLSSTEKWKEVQVSFQISQSYKVSVYYMGSSILTHKIYSYYLSVISLSVDWGHYHFLLLCVLFSMSKVMMLCQVDTIGKIYFNLFLFHWIP